MQVRVFMVKLIGEKPEVYNDESGFNVSRTANEVAEALETTVEYIQELSDYGVNEMGEIVSR